MAGGVLTVEGIVLTRALSAGGFDRLAVLTQERGLVHVMRRVATSSKAGTVPDLFDSASLVLTERRADAFFLSEYTLVRRRTGIGARYGLLAAASKWAGFVAANAGELETTQKLCEISTKLLDALEEGTAPGTALFKALFLFAKSEGLPVRGEWLAGLSAAGRETAERLLSTPLGEIAGDGDAEGGAFAESVLRWMCGFHDILPPRMEE
ncbi:MAG TPA: hypothetical protein PKI32_02555 [Opitutales bacterium]|nr:hypothetical protein [Opitutales bacterium]